MRRPDLTLYGGNIMKCKRVISAGLVIAFVLGFSGCNSKKDTEAIDGLLTDYNEALNELDADAVRELSDWTKKDFDYQNIGELMTVKSVDAYDAEQLEACAGYIASTIEVNYDIDDLTVKGDRASIKVEYELVDWESVYYVDCHETYADVLKELKRTKDTITIRTKISFEKKNGAWKLCQLSKLSEVFKFNEEGPYVLTPVFIDPDPTGETTSGTTLSTEPGTDDRSYLIEAALNNLKEHESGIRAIESGFMIDACGVYDINGDGMEELFYIEADQEYGGEVFSGKLCICAYNWYAGEYVNVISVPGIIYMAAGGGSYAAFATDSEFVIVSEGGEESLYHITTDVYDLDWNLTAGYKRNVYYDYNPDLDLETYTYEYFLNDKIIQQDDYNSRITDYVRRARVVMDMNFTPLADDVEYPLVGKPSAGMMGYDEAVKYIKSLQYTV